MGEHPAGEAPAGQQAAGQDPAGQGAPPAAAQASEDPLLSAPPTLAPLVGTWEASGEVLGDDGESVVGVLRGTDVYRWLGPTVVHEVDVEVGDRRTRSLEVVEPYDARRGAFPTRAYDDEGGVDVSTATVDAGGTWTFRSPGARTTLRVSEDGASMSALRMRAADGDDVPWVRLSWRRTG